MDKIIGWKGLSLYLASQGYSITEGGLANKAIKNKEFYALIKKIGNGERIYFLKAEVDRFFFPDIQNKANCT